MRILLVATPAFHNGARGAGAGWTSAMQRYLVSRHDVELGVCFTAPGPAGKEVQDGVAYYHLPPHRKTWPQKLIDIVRWRDVGRDERLWPHYTEQFRAFVRDFRPDVVHIFGTELYTQLMALATGGVPTLIHIQGLLSLSIYILLPPGVTRYRLLGDRPTPRNIFRSLEYWAYWRRSAHRERAILRAARHVAGRTEWDRLGSALLAPHARYHHAGELLREAFYQPLERRPPQRTVIVTTTSAPLYKGFDLILNIADILRRRAGLDFEWRVFGLVTRKAAERRLGLDHAALGIRLMGYATAETLREAYAGATLYVQPSYIENSPNSLAEAQICGLPAVATAVGGTPSMIAEGSTGFLFPATDPYMGASHILTLARDAALNTDMGRRAAAEARRRHDPDTIMRELMQTYREVISDY